MSRLFKQMTICGCAFTMVAASLVVIPQSADAQIFPRLNRWRCCPDPCATYRVTRFRPATYCCYNGNMYGDGYTTYSNGYTVYSDGYYDTNPIVQQQTGQYTDQNTGQTYQEGDIVSPPSPNYSDRVQIESNQQAYDGRARTELDADVQVESDASDRFAVDQEARLQTQTEAGISVESRTPQDRETRIAQERPAIDRNVAQNQEVQRDPQQALTTFYASKLYLANHCTTELSQLALEKTTSAAVREFAQSLQQEHSQFNAKLRQLAANEIVSAFPVKYYDETQPRSDLAQETRDGDSDTTTVARANYNVAMDPVMQQMTNVCRDAAEFGLESAKGILNEYSGQDFDMGYIGIEIAKHTAMIAELKALQGVGTQEFETIVDNAISATEMHLERARELARQLEDDRQQDDESIDFEESSSEQLDDIDEPSSDQ